MKSKSRQIDDSIDFIASFIKRLEEYNIKDKETIKYYLENMPPLIIPCYICLKENNKTNKVFDEIRNKDFAQTVLNVLDEIA